MPKNSPIVYLEYRPLPEPLKPCYLDRGPRVTLLYVDPDVRCREASAWIVQHMTRSEQNFIRAAYCVPPVGRGGDPGWVSDDLVRATAWTPDVLVPPDVSRVLPARTG